jgi:mRNA interferase MazF
MRRGDVYLVEPMAGGPRRGQLFVVLGRQLALDSDLAMVICAPIFSSYDGLATQVAVGAADGLPGEGAIHCEALATLPKTALTRFVVCLGVEKLKAVEGALAVALDLTDDDRL